MRTRQLFGVSSFPCGRTFRASFVSGKFTFHALFLCLFTCIRCSFPLRADWPKLTALSTGRHRGTGGRIQITETWLQALHPFLPCCQSALGELARWRWRSENSPFIMQNSWVNVSYPDYILCRHGASFKIFSCNVTIFSCYFNSYWKPWGRVVMEWNPHIPF